MAKKKKGSGKKKQSKKVNLSLQRSSGDLVEIQIAIEVTRKPKGVKLTRELINTLIRHKAATSRGVWKNTYVAGAFEGEDPPGMKIKIIRWRNPDRLAEEDAGWRSGSQAEAWGSLRRVVSVV